MTRPLSRAKVAALADDLRRMLATIEAGDLDATTAMRHRIEGALAVLEVVQGRSARLSSTCPKTRYEPMTLLDASSSRSTHQSDRRRRTVRAKMIVKAIG